MYADPKLRKGVAGHGPGKRPLRGPFRVVSVVGQKCRLEHADSGVALADTVHAEALVALPAEVEDYKSGAPKPPLELEADAANDRRSPGQLAEARDAPAPADSVDATAVRRRLRQLQLGRMWRTRS